MGKSPFWVAQSAFTMAIFNGKLSQSPPTPHLDFERWQLQAHPLPWLQDGRKGLLSWIIRNHKRPGKAWKSCELDMGKFMLQCFAQWKETNIALIMLIIYIYIYIHTDANVYRWYKLMTNWGFRCKKKTCWWKNYTLLPSTTNSLEPTSVEWCRNSHYKRSNKKTWFIQIDFAIEICFIWI